MTPTARAQALAVLRELYCPRPRPTKGLDWNRWANANEAAVCAERAGLHLDDLLRAALASDCQRCDGMGTIWGDVGCPTCNGRGRV